MILQNFREQLRAANWSAVIIELLVVVLGVYGAFQLERMAEEWRDSRREAEYLVQLHDELIQAETRVRERIEEDQQETSTVDDAVLLLMRPLGSGDLSTELCESIFEVSILRYLLVSLITVDEMINTGFISALKDQKLKRLLFQLQSEIEQRNTFMELIRPQQNILMDMYPELLPRRLSEEMDVAETIACDTDAMRSSQAFINHLMSNRGRHIGLTVSNGRTQKSVQEVHARLDQVLGVSHPQ